MENRDKSSSMHLWQKNSNISLKKKRQWAIIIQYNYSFGFHKKLKKKKKKKSPATNLLPVAAEKYYSEILVKLGQIVK